MKGAAIVTLAVAAFLGHTSVAAELTRDDATRPIIAQLLNDPGAYANKTVTIYGLVIRKIPIGFHFTRRFPATSKVVGTSWRQGGRWRSNHDTRRPLKKSQWSYFSGAFADADARSWRRRLLLKVMETDDFLWWFTLVTGIGAAALSFVQRCSIVG